VAEELNDDRQWEIRVLVPMRLPVEMRQDLFEAVAQAVSRWEPVNRDGWDADVSGCPERQRLTYRESQELLWLHAEAVWREQDLTRQRDAWWEVQSRRVGALIVERDEAAASRQAWAEEAMRLEVRLEQVRADRQRRIDNSDRLRTALCVAFGYDTDPDEYPGDDALVERLSSSVLPDGEAQ
jgi:hypothetical protein